MSLNVVLRPQARREILDAYNWYEMQREGLGDELRSYFKLCIARILENPSGFQEAMPKIRRAKLDVFPYAVFFQVRPDEIVIHSFFHLSRNPKVWKRGIRRER